MHPKKAFRKVSTPLQLFHVSGLLEFVAMHILGLLLKTVSGNQFVMVMTDRYKNWTKVVPSSRMTDSNIASLFLENWIISYRIPK